MPCAQCSTQITASKSSAQVQGQSVLESRRVRRVREGEVCKTPCAQCGINMTAQCCASARAKRVPGRRARRVTKGK
eukprot:4687321-Pleurochrysis_carterae.AAC.1